MNMPARTVTTVVTDRPGPVTLAQMGRTARAAADTLAMRTWAARLATRAAPKDFVGQLRQLYAGIVSRWRYVMEDGEWIHGTPRSLLGTVLGLDYNAPGRDPTSVDIDATPVREHGWGDCDDVSTLAAAGVLALGMRPVFRVSRTASGQAHVNCDAVTPDGQLVHLDPVGHPAHGFNWAQSGPGIEVSYFNLDGFPLSAPTLGRSFGEIGTMAHPAFKVAPPVQPGPQFYPASFVAPALTWQAVPYGFGEAGANDGTYLGVLARAPRGGLMPYQGRVRRHLVCVSPNDTRGPRVLAVPGMHARAMMGGCVMDGTPAVDQFGTLYTYSQPADLWLPRQSAAARVAAYGFGSTKAQRKAKRKARRRRAAKKIGRFFMKVGQGIRKVAAKLMGSKFVQTIVAGALQVFGVPMPITRKLLEVASKFVGSGGLIKLLKGIRKNPKKVLQTIAKTVAAAGRSDLLKGVKGFGSVNNYEPVLYQVEQHGVPFYAAPVEGIVGLDGVFGDGGEGAAFAAEPTPGYFYRVRPGDAPDSIARRAYGKAHPGGRWISQSPTNAYCTRASKTDYEKKYYGERIINLVPKFSGEIPGGPGQHLPAIWIPPVEGVEPTVAPVFPDGPTPDVDDEAFEDEPDEPSPGDVPVPPVPPDVEPGELVPPEGGPVPIIPPPTPVEPYAPDPTPLPVEPEPTPPDGLKPVPWPDDTPAPGPTPSGPPRPAPRDDVGAFVPIAMIASLLML